MAGRGTVASGKRGPGRRVHGAYGVLAALADGVLDRRTKPALAIKALYERLAADLGGEEGLSVQQRVLVEGVAIKVVVTNMIASYAISRGVIGEDGDLLPSLGERFLAWSNSARLDLLALGLEKRLPVIDLSTYVGKKYGRARGKASPSRPGAADGQRRGAGVTLE